MLFRLLAFTLGLVATFAGNPVAAESGHRGLLWTVSSPTTTLHLLGTIHVGSKAFHPLPPAIEAAYAQADVLALEADVSDTASLLAIAPSFVYAAPDNLGQHVPPEVYRDTLDALRTLGIPAEAGRTMKPHMLSMTLTVVEAGRHGMDAALGLDLQLAQRAHRDGKRIVELESIAMQMTMMDSLAPDVQVAMLAETVRAVRDGSLGRELGAMLEAWLRGDAERLDRIVSDDLDRMPDAVAANLKAALFDDRNDAMVERIATMLAGREVVLVAVGAGHMTGPGGLVELLRARGFTVERR